MARLTRAINGRSRDWWVGTEVPGRRRALMAWGTWGSGILAEEWGRDEGIEDSETPRNVKILQLTLPHEGSSLSPAWTDLSAFAFPPSMSSGLELGLSGLMSLDVFTYAYQIGCVNVMLRICIIYMNVNGVVLLLLSISSSLPSLSFSLPLSLSLSPLFLSSSLSPSLSLSLPFFSLFSLSPPLSLSLPPSLSLPLSLSCSLMIVSVIPSCLPHLFPPRCLLWFVMGSDPWFTSVVLATSAGMVAALCQTSPARDPRLIPRDECLPSVVTKYTFGNLAIRLRLA